jgi:hypothetical protein
VKREPTARGLTPDELDLGRGLGPEPVIDARDPDDDAELGREPTHHVEECHGVRPPGAREENALAAEEEPTLAECPSHRGEHGQNRPDKSANWVSRTSRSEGTRETVTAGIPSPSRPRETRRRPPPASASDASAGGSSGGT